MPFIKTLRILVTRKASYWPDLLIYDKLLSNSKGPCKATLILSVAILFWPCTSCKIFLCLPIIISNDASLSICSSLSPAAKMAQSCTLYMAIFMFETAVFRLIRCLFSKSLSVNFAYFRIYKLLDSTVHWLVKLQSILISKLFT